VWAVSSKLPSRHCGRYSRWISPRRGEGGERGGEGGGRRGGEEGGERERRGGREGGGRERERRGEREEAVVEEAAAHTQAEYGFVVRPIVAYWCISIVAGAVYPVLPSPAASFRTSTR
jgi:hypothetical protein